MRTSKLHFEQIPVATVKKIAKELPLEENPQDEKKDDWRKLAHRAETEPDGKKMIELVQQVIEKFDQDRLAPSGPANRARIGTIRDGQPE